MASTSKPYLFSFTLTPPPVPTKLHTPPLSPQSFTPHPCPHRASHPTLSPQSFTPHPVPTELHTPPLSPQSFTPHPPNPSISPDLFFAFSSSFAQRGRLQSSSATTMQTWQSRGWCLSPPLPIRNHALLNSFVPLPVFLILFFLISVPFPHSLPPTVPTLLFFFFNERCGVGLIQRYFWTAFPDSKFSRRRNDRWSLPPFSSESNFTPDLDPLEYAQVKVGIVPDSGPSLNRLEWGEGWWWWWW